MVLQEEQAEDHQEAILIQRELEKQQVDGESNERDQELKDRQTYTGRPYQNQRGGRGGGRRGYLNGRGGRRGSSYQNGRTQYYDQPANYYPRNNYYNRGRSGRGGSHAYNSQGERSSEDVSVAS